MILKIGNIAMPQPAMNGFTVKPEKIMSKNTGRSSSGEMVGDIVATKLTISIKWPPLTESEVSTIAKAITPAFFDVNFRNPITKTQETRRFYSGSLTIPFYSEALDMYSGVSLDIIEK